MPSITKTLLALLPLTLPTLCSVSVSAAPSSVAASVDHPHGFHAPPYLASSLANAGVSKRHGQGNHARRGLAKKFGSRGKMTTMNESKEDVLVVGSRASVGGVESGKSQNSRRRKMNARGGERGLRRSPESRSEGDGVGMVERSADGYYGDLHGFSRPSPINLKRAEAQIPTGWSYTGCITESDADVRVLDGFSYLSDTGMTPLQCLTICQGFGYTYAGMEYADECYCASSLSGDGGVVVADSECDMPCTGEASAMCGAAWRVSLYTYDAADSVACPTVTSTSATNATMGSNTTTTTTSSAVTSATSIAATATSSGASNATITVAVNSSETSEWYSLGCAVDDSYSTARIMSYTLNLDDTSITIDECLSECEALSYKYAGLENGNQCFCASTLASTTSYVADSECDNPCTGDATEMCGGEYRMDIYELYQTYEDCTSTSSSGAVATSTAIAGVGDLLGLGGSTGASTSTSTAASATATVGTSTTASAAAVATSAIPASSGAHAVYAHFMVGNSYGYDSAHWASDIALAQAAGIDGFALNMGSDSWQPARVADAYTAAAAVGFEMFISLDMSSLACSSSSDLSNLVSIITTQASSSAQALYESRVLVSTFSGESCYFGTSSVSDGWQAFVTDLSNDGVDSFFIPSIFSDISTFASNAWMDGELNWNGGWPTAGSDLTTASDLEYIEALDGKLYMGAISPAFFTHFGVDTYNKNWLYRGDDWLYITRWEQMISMRDQINLVEILTMNDVGESSYLLPIDPDVNDSPTGSLVWCQDFPHTGWLDLTLYYATAFKTGSYPTITTDSITMWARPHPATATASDDSVGRPTNYQDTDDNVYALIMATAAGTVTMTAGSTSETFSVVAGPNKIKMASAAGSMSASLTRNGATVVSYDAGSSYTYTTTPVTYNYNYFVGSSGSWA